MKTAFIFTGTFWGVLIVLIGISIICKALFGFSFPFFRILFALFLIYIGIIMLFKTNLFKSKNNNAVFENKSLGYKENQNEYSTVFGKSIIDLTMVPTKSEIEVSTVFGSSTIYIDSTQSYKIKVNAAFASADLPDESKTIFGTHIYKSPAYQKGGAYISVELNIVFGNVKVVFKHKG